MNENDKNEVNFNKAKRQRRFSHRQKVEIIKEAEESMDFYGVADKYGIGHSNLYRWRIRILNNPKKYGAICKEIGYGKKLYTEEEYLALKQENDKLKDVVIELSVENSELRRKLTILEMK